jgi:hypothetical protein
LNGGPTYNLPAIRRSGDAILVKVRAQPAASRDGITGVHGDALKVAVTASPERGKANAAVERTVARALGVRASSVRVHSGATSRDKWVAVEGLDLEEATRRVAQALPDRPPTAGDTKP